MATTEKRTLAVQIAAHPSSIHSADYYTKRYTLAELKVLAEAYGHADLWSRPARKLFDAVQWSRQLRTNAKLRARVEANGFTNVGGILR